MAFHMKALHFSALGMGITAIGALVAIVYYRNSQAAQAASQGAAPPMFQTAAVPAYSGGAGGSSGGSSGGGVTPGGSTVPGTVAAPGTGSIGQTVADLASTVAAQIAATTQTGNNAITAGLNETFTANTEPLLSQLVAQLPDIREGGSNNLNLSLTGGGGTSLNLTGTYGSTASPIPVYTPPPIVNNYYAAPEQPAYIPPIIVQPPPPPAVTYPDLGHYNPDGSLPGDYNLRSQGGE